MSNTVTDTSSPRLMLLTIFVNYFYFEQTIFAIHWNSFGNVSLFKPRSQVTRLNNVRMTISIYYLIVVYVITTVCLFVCYSNRHWRFQFSYDLSVCHTPSSLRRVKANLNATMFVLNWKLPTIFTKLQAKQASNQPTETRPDEETRAQLSRVSFTKRFTYAHKLTLL